MFRLYTEDTAHTDATETALACLAQSHIDGATLFSAVGYWQGTRERALIIETDGNAPDIFGNSATARRARVYDAAELIRVALNQEAVLVLETEDSLTYVTAPLAVAALH